MNLTDLKAAGALPRLSEKRGTLLTEFQRVPFLDGWRGMAIALVLLNHGCNRFTAETHGEKLFKIFFGGYGWAGVDLFFVLSGYLITGILLDTKESHTYFR